MNSHLSTHSGQIRVTSRKNGWNDDGCGKKVVFPSEKLDLGKKFLKNDGFLGMVVLGPYRGPLGRGETRSGQSGKKAVFP